MKKLKKLTSIILLSTIVLATPYSNTYAGEVEVSPVKEIQSPILIAPMIFEPSPILGMK